MLLRFLLSDLYILYLYILHNIAVSDVKLINMSTHTHTHTYYIYIYGIYIHKSNKNTQFQTYI